MWIKSLYLRNFRNYEQVVANFGPGINFIQGKNGHGKTNLLEAIYFLSTGRSFRTERIADLIKEDQSHFYIEAIFEKNGIEQRVKIQYDGKIKKIETLEKTTSNFSTLLGLIPSVIAAPSDIQLIMGAPALRRRFLNIQIAQSDPLYVYHLSRYNKALKHRNALLKAKELATIDIWENEMALSASYIIGKRIEYLKLLSENANLKLKDLSQDNETLFLKYNATIPIEGNLQLALKSQMEKFREREIHHGNTQVGPHRDDISILHNEKSAKVFSSEGQKHSILTALRFAERKTMGNIHGSPPLFGIDDFGTHLDAQRKELLKTQLKEGGQIFLTTPDLEIDAHHAFLVENGTISNVKPALHLSPYILSQQARYGTALVKTEAVLTMETK
ncbi:MAG: DNA replication/repair protein RecF [Rhabdochlamydiaceae bacterium]|nr:DNA replication/repair protein RecF [Candidatus Amphrikana amoebophyrae]